MTIRTVGILGGGVSGLSAGVYLARQGFHVKLFEANDRLGGCCSTTNLQGYVFNNGAMYIAVPEILDHAFERLGLDRVSQLPLRKIHASQKTKLPDGSIVEFHEGRTVEVFGADGAARRETMQKEIDALLDKWEPVLHLFTHELIPYPFSVWKFLRKGWRQLPKLRGTVAAELTRTFSDPAVRAAMAGVLLYTGLAPEKMPVFQVIGLVALFGRGFYLPEGGMGAIPDVLARTFVNHGGEISLGAKVKRIKLERSKVSGFTLEGGEEIHVDAVISTAGGMTTFNELIDKNHLPGSLTRKVKNTPLSHRALCVQLGLKEPVDAKFHSVSNLPLMEEQYKAFSQGHKPLKWFNYTVSTVTMPELAPAGGSIIEMFPPIDRSRPIDDWDEEAKEAVASEAIRALSEHHQLNVVVKRVIGPKDYRDAMHLFGGAVYGISPGAKPNAQFPHQTSIPRLFLAGQTTYPGYGVSTAMLSGIFAAEALMNSVRA